MTAKNLNLQGYEKKKLELPRYNKIIIIDDSEMDLEIEKIILRGINLSKTIEIKLKAEEVLQELQNIKRLDEVPELIFLDLNMPGMSGMAFLTEFSLLPEFIKQKCGIVVVTSSNDQKTVDMTYSNPSVIDYVVKPLDAENARKFLTHDNTTRY